MVVLPALFALIEHFVCSSGRPMLNTLRFCDRAAAWRSWRRLSSDRLQPAAASAGSAAPQQVSSTRLPRLFYPSPLQDSAEGSTLQLEGEEAKHMKVLRMKESDVVELCDGVGRTLECRVVSVDRGRAWVEALAPPVLHPWRGPMYTVAVACTTLKGTRADWLIEKCVELGAFRFVPLLTERSQVAGRAKFRTSGGGGDGGSSKDVDGYQPGRLERVAVAAAKQSLRTHAMALHPPLAFDYFVARWVQPSELALVGAEGAPPLRQVVADWQQRRRRLQDGSVAAAGGAEATAPSVRSSAIATVAGGASPVEPRQRLLIIGPEGDFTPAELQQLDGAGALRTGLGSNRLRTETAAVALLAAAPLMMIDAD